MSDETDFEFPLYLTATMRAMFFVPKSMTRKEFEFLQRQVGWCLEVLEAFAITEPDETIEPSAQNANEPRGTDSENRDAALQEADRVPQPVGNQDAGRGVSGGTGSESGAHNVVRKMRSDGGPAGSLPPG